MEFLTFKQIKEFEPLIRSAFDGLINNPIVATKPNSKQWRFFKECFENLFGGLKKSAFSNLQMAQYKHEVQNRLHQYYFRSGSPIEFVFFISHKRDIEWNKFSLEKRYPSLGDYYLLVRDSRENPVDINMSRNEEIAYLEKIVGLCVDAEFEAYENLPKVSMKSLLEYFYKDGAALMAVEDILKKQSKRGWVLSNPGNPSTKRLIKTKVVQFDGKSAKVRTREYWFLRWWNDIESKYKYTYRETNTQTYFLEKINGKWLVVDDIRPNPKTSMFTRVSPKRKKV